MVIITAEQKGWLWSELCLSAEGGLPWQGCEGSLASVNKHACRFCLVSFLYNCTRVKPVKSSHYNSCEEEWRYLDYRAWEGGESGGTKQKRCSRVEITLNCYLRFFYASRTSGSLSCCVKDAFSYLWISFLKCKKPPFEDKPAVTVSMFVNVFIMMLL